MSWGQNDSISLKKNPKETYEHNRKRALILSTSFPGLGQFYNEYGYRKVQNRKHLSWWRAPIYWTGLYYSGKFAIENINQANRYKKEWLFRQDNNGAYFHQEYQDLELGDLETKYLEHISFRDYSIAAFVLIYGFNVLESFVTAHFVSFDVSDVLTIQTYPIYYPNQYYGVGLHLNFN